MLDDAFTQDAATRAATAASAASAAAVAAQAAQAATAAANLALTTANTNAGIMAELSAIKTNLALNTQETANTRKDVEKGFNEVHIRQDYTNGKVTTNTVDIIKIKSKSNYDKLIWGLCTVLVGIVVYYLEKH